MRYAPWLAEKDAGGNCVNLHPDNSELYGTENVRPIRYLVTIYKFVSKINGEVLYIPGGTWTDWSIDMPACNSRSLTGVGTTPWGSTLTTAECIISPLRHLTTASTARAIWSLNAKRPTTPTARSQGSHR